MKEANYMIVLSNSIFSFMGWTKGNAVVRANSDFTHVASIYFFIVTKESRFTKEMDCHGTQTWPPLHCF